jgi:spore maturation protein CgeB
VRIVAFSYGDPPKGRPLLRDSVEGFCELGHSVQRIDLFNFKGESDKEKETLVKEIVGFRPDALYSINYFDLVGQISLILRVPYIAWFGDNPHIFLDRSRPYPYTIFFVWDKVYVKQLKERGFEHTFYLPLATNPKRFRPLDLSDEDKKRYGCDISFVGGSSYGNYRIYNNLVKDGPMRRLYDEVIGVMCENPSLNIGDVLDQVQESHGHIIRFKDIEQRRRIEGMLNGVVTSIMRGRIINSITEFGVCVWGDDGWREIVEDRVKLFGKIDYFNEVPKLYNASKINLNITVHQSKGAVSQRPYDISAAGAFCLSDYRWELGNQFILGEEMICYRNLNELKELVKYYLDHPRERREAAKRARKRVLRDHTYRIRMEQMLDIARGLF